MRESILDGSLTSADPSVISLMFRPTLDRDDPRRNFAGSKT